MELRWHNLMAKFTLHPRAVARQLLANLEGIKSLSPSEEGKVIDAIENTGIQTERVLASLSKQVLETMLKQI